MNSAVLESEATGIVAALVAPFVMTLGRSEEDDRDGSLFPKEVFSFRVTGFLFLSSTIGILIGDWTWLQALKILGAKRVILVDSLKPFLAALFGWLLLDESLRAEAFGGIALTVVGILVVSFEQEASPDKVGEVVNDITDVATAHQNPTTLSLEDDADIAVSKDAKGNSEHQSLLGFGLAFLNVVLDTYGSVLTKQYGVHLTVWEINLLRFGFAAAIMLLVSVTLTLCGYASIRIDSLSDQEFETPSRWFVLPLKEMKRIDWLKVSGGVALVTFATPALSSYALFQIALALALTLGSVGPLYQLPLSYLIQKRPPTRRSILGAFCAVAGVAILAFRGEAPSG